MLEEVEVGMSDFRDFNEWELVSVNSFLNLLHLNIPRGKGCDRMSWSLRGSGASNVCSS